MGAVRPCQRLAAYRDRCHWCGLAGNDMRCTIIVHKNNQARCKSCSAPGFGFFSIFPVCDDLLGQGFRGELLLWDILPLLGHFP